jgi:hypothetical protein
VRHSDLSQNIATILQCANRYFKFVFNVNVQIILCTFTAAGTGAKFPNFIVVFVCSGGAAAQVVTFLDVYDSIWVQYQCHFFLHNSVQEKFTLSWLQKGDN